jgi:hypothetical protein
METLETLGNQKLQKSCINYYCKDCHYNTSRKSSYNKHLLSLKHNKCENGTQMELESCKKLQKACNNNYICKNCNKEYINKSGLWKHKMKCKINTSTTPFESINQQFDNNNKDDIIQLLLKQNNDLIKEQADIKQIILEIVKTGTSNNVVNSNNVNSHNKTFNLQVFLNETCKDAMNISDFVESVKLQVSDLENVGKVGYIEGISNIIIKNLNALEVEKRPVHCTDQKREVMYVKEDNVWEKEDEANKKLRKAIRMIAHKNICMFKEFREKYPDYDDYDSKRNSQYNTIVYEAMGGKGDNDYEKDTKIIKKIAKNVTIDK